VTVKRSGITSRYSEQATGRTTTELAFDSRQGTETFLFSTASRSALEPSKLLIQLVPGVSFLRVKVKLATHLYLMPSLRMRLHGVVLN
jgi:hypothetical protein